MQYYNRDLRRDPHNFDNYPYSTYFSPKMGSHSTTSGPKYVPYSYMDPCGSLAQVFFRAGTSQFEFATTPDKRGGSGKWSLKLGELV